MLTIHDTINGTGNLIIDANSATPLILGDNAIATYGQGASHTRLNVSDASVGNIGDDWASLTYLSRNNIYHNVSSSETYSIPVRFLSGSTYIESDLIAAAGSDGAFTFDVYGGSSVGGVYLGADIVTDGGDIVIEDSIVTTTLNNDVVLNAKTGTVTIGTSGITGGNYDIEIIGSTPVVKAAVTTIGDVTLRPYDDATSIGIGSGAGAFSVSDALLSNFTGQTTLIIGHDTSSGVVTIDNADMSGGSYDVQLYGGGFVIDNGFDAGDSVFIKAAGDITLNSVVSSTGSGNSIVLVAGDEFINNHGALALDPGSGRFLVYASEESKITENGLIASSVYSSTYNSNPPASIDGADNNFIYEKKVSPEQKEVSVIVVKQVNNITTAQPFNQKTISSSYGFLSGKPTPVSADDTNLVEAEEPVDDFYDLCLYNEAYCH